MMIRRVTLHAQPVLRRAFVKHSQQWPVRSRQFGSWGFSQAQASSNTASASPLIAAIGSELDRRGPRIDIRPEQIRVIFGPKEFYATLQEKILSARKRIYLSTLYFGRAEDELVVCLRQALRRNPELKVSILTDALRGTREAPKPSCASLLVPLAQEFPDRVEIRMYHTPNLRGLRKKLIPKRINEGWGLQHMKLYGFDDEVILSGANLSGDYFTNRQDRYHVFSSKAVADYYEKIHDGMCSLSFAVTPEADKPGGFNMSWPETNAGPSPLDGPRAYIEASKRVFAPLIAPPAADSAVAPASTNTSVYPVLIIPRAMNTELPTVRTLLTSYFPRGSSYLFTAGYFNPSPLVTATLLEAASSNRTGPNGDSQPAAVPAGTILTASPWANGFYNSPGISGLLPAGYTLLARRFLIRARSTTPEGAVQLREWRLGTVGRPHGWTYHAKGLWITLPPNETSPSEEKAEEAGPSLTLIGSSNYTVRSYALDTEVGAVVLTSDDKLKRDFKREQDNLLEHSREKEVDDLRGGERRVGVAVRVALWIVGAVGGSL